MSAVMDIGYVDPKGAVIRKPGVGIIFAQGTTVPTDTTAGYAPGCIFLDLDASAGSQAYINEGTSTSCDFNAIVLAGVSLSGLLATADEINRAADASTRIVNTTATTLAVSVASHDQKIIVVDAAAPFTATLPAASGSGAVYTFIINTAATGTAHVITCGTLDILKGFAHFSSTTTDDAHSFLTTATDDKISLNGTTKGGLGGDKIVITDAKLSIYQISAWLCGSGTLETGFAAT